MNLNARFDNRLDGLDLKEWPNTRDLHPHLHKVHLGTKFRLLAPSGVKLVVCPHH